MSLDAPERMRVRCACSVCVLFAVVGCAVWHLVAVATAAMAAAATAIAPPPLPFTLVAVCALELMHTLRAEWINKLTYKHSIAAILVRPLVPKTQDIKAAPAVVSPSSVRPHTYNKPSQV